MSLQSRLTHPQIRYGNGGIAELAAFKLQWNCRDRNIDRARRWGVSGLDFWAEPLRSTFV